jgi:hypothetical protein
MSATPPPGPDLDFETWVRRVVAAVRAQLIDVVVTRRGRAVIFRRRGEAVTIAPESGSWFVWREGPQRRVMLSIANRRDAFVADNTATTIATALGD